MKVADLRSYFQDELKGIYPVDEVDSFFVLLAEAWLGYSRLDLTLQREAVVSSEVNEKFNESTQRLKKEEPIQYILGTTEFYGLTMEVTPATLIPRPETEELVEIIVKEHSKSTRILDIGTGSGCIAIALARNLPGANVTGLDISEPALEVARKNAVVNRVRVDFMKYDILKTTELPGKYDLIVSNPPYVRELEKANMNNNVLKYEPGSALFVPDEDPLVFYRSIVELSGNALNHQGWILFEINEYLGEEMVNLLKEKGFDKVELIPDFRGKDRFVRGQFLKNDRT